MASADSQEMSPGLLKVAERARVHPQSQFNSLAHLVDIEALKRSYKALRKDAAVGVDGVTVEQYGQNLEDNLRGLHQRLKNKQYRHQPIRRVHVPKDGGKSRPIGVSCTEDKIVQGAIREVLEAVYEQDFVLGSYGFRPERGPRDALRATDRMIMGGWVGWILETDVQNFFDSIDRKKLVELLQRRVADPSLLRLIGKCLHVGVLDGAKYSEPDEGTAQGSIISPLLGNVYLHYVLDQWFEVEVKPRLQGRAELVRYADDLVMGFESREDAERVLAWMQQRMAQYNLTLHPEKTRILAFGRPDRTATGGERPSTFDFLGFTMYWRRTRRGRWVLGMKTRKARLQRAFKRLKEWCRRHRHLPKQEQHAALSKKLVGHFNWVQIFRVNQ